MNQTNIKKDLVVSLVLGEVCALLMLAIGKNLQITPLLPYLNFLPIVFPLLCALGLIVSYYISKKLAVFYQFAKFVLIGGTNFLIDMGVLNLLIFATGTAVGPKESLFKATSYVVATINSYFFNKFWTFKRTSTESKGKEFLQFFAVSMIGFLINLSINYFVVNKMAPAGGLNNESWAQIGGLIAAMAALFWNFIGYKFIVFDENESNSPVQKI